MSEYLSLHSLAALASLTALEIVLGIDNIVFIAVLTGRLPLAAQALARRLGMSLALITRILLLLGITWVMGLTRPLFEVMGHSFTGRDLILLGGGLFLLVKATHEIHGQIEGAQGEGPAQGGASFWPVVIQIGLLDIIFSLDSVITAVGMAKELAIMITAVVAAMLVMIWFSGPVSHFISRHPTMRVLALSFLILIGVMLLAEGVGQHIDRGYIYFAMAFSLGVELVNMRVRPRAPAPVEPAE
ncbi:MAG: TerC family protein [Deltaproteobacteria bacterium]|nr:TerC family protein [Deltaproteobacteria bacterium]